MSAAAQSIVDSLNFVRPEVLLIGVACILFLYGGFGATRNFCAAISVLALAGAALLWWGEHNFKQLSAVGDVIAEQVNLEASPFRTDKLGWLIRGISLATGMLLAFTSWNQVRDRHWAEYYACLLLIVVGVNLVAAANELITLFLALELISIPTYILLYLPRQDAQAQEAATKYFLLSVFSSALLLYGFSFLYGLVGSTNLEVIRSAIRTAESGPMPGVLIISLVMIVAGLGFRITAVPFHFYAPDVYQGAPTVAAALLAFVPKIAGFMALYRLVTATLLVEGTALREWSLNDQTILLVWIIAAVTMCLGNVLALLQDNVKRILAYSSVAHAGYMLIGFGVGQSPATMTNGLNALLFYLVVYGVMTIGAFAVLAYLSKPERAVETVDDLAGVGVSHPMVALMMAVFLFSLTGLPPTAGFWAKLNLFFAAWSEGTYLFKILAIVMAINAAIGAWYYLRIVAAMYLRQPIKPLPPTAEVPGMVSLAACTFLTLYLFLTPAALMRLIERTTAASTTFQ